MTPVEVHANNLAWVRCEWAAWEETVGPIASQFIVVPGLVLAESILKRHEPMRMPLNDRDEWEPDECKVCNYRIWPCPDAQAALDFIKAIR